MDLLGKGWTSLAEPAARPLAGAPVAASVEPAVASASRFESIFREQFTLMVRLAHLLGSDDPENAAQEAFSRLHAKLSGLTEPERAVGYLRACLVNITRSRHAHLAVVNRQPPLVEGEVASAESTALAYADQALVIAALARLTPRHREALVLRYWLDLSERQMAEAMGTSVGTVKSHVSRGLSALRAVLDAEPTDGER